MDDRVICLGVRGSLPVCRADSMCYGGSTMCILVRLADGLFVLDAGTGLAALPRHLEAKDTHLTLIMTHAHADHVIGLPYLMKPCRDGLKPDIYGRTRLGKTVREQLDTLMAPPLWPVGMDVVAPGARYAELEEKQTVGNVTVEAVEGVHPGGVSVIKLAGNGKRVVLMTDCTVNDENREKLTAFARNCDVLLIDGQYADGEWRGRETFGHNAYRAAADFGKQCRAKQVRIIHHAPYRTDDELENAAREIGCRFAKEGEVIGL